MSRTFRFFYAIVTILLAICVSTNAYAIKYSVNVPVLNLRSCKGTNCKIVAKLTSGEIVDVEDNKGTWVKVKTKKGNGYVIKSSLKQQSTESSSEDSSSAFYWIIAIVIIFVIASKSNKDKTNLPAKASEKKNKKSSLYDILDISSEASTDEIKKSYKKLAKKYHPDLNPDKKMAAEQFREINEAYEILMDKQKRADYDASLNEPEEEEYSEEKILLTAGSIQELRGMLAECLNISSRVIQFTHDGNVFVNKQYAYCWRPVERDAARYHPYMKIHWEYYTEICFEYYRPIKPIRVERNTEALETILLTAPDIDSLRILVGMCFNRTEKSVLLATNGQVFVDAEPAWLWRYSDNGYFEYYIPEGDDFDIWFARF